MSALHYAVFVPRTCGIVKVLLRHKANVNLQDRFGASPLLMAIGKGSIDVIPALLDAGGNLDVTDGEGSSPRSVYLTSPAKVSNVVKSWLVKHEGKNSVLQGDRCSKCGIRSASVKRCARCRSRLYCSPECQSESVRTNIVRFHTPHDTSFDQRGGLERAQKKLPTVRKGGQSSRRDTLIHIRRVYHFHCSIHLRGLERTDSQREAQSERPRRQKHGTQDPGESPGR